MGGQTPTHKVFGCLGTLDNQGPFFHCSLATPAIPRNFPPRPTGALLLCRSPVWPSRSGQSAKGTPLEEVETKQNIAVTFQKIMIGSCVYKIYVYIIYLCIDII